MTSSTREDPDAALQRLAGAVASARGIVVITGAGVSAESGLRTFRGASAADLPEELRAPNMEALWREFDPAKLATPEAFEADPAMVTRWYDWRRRGCLAAVPNAGHMALARLEAAAKSRNASFTLLTQNVDRLHQRAGSQNVIELHGSIIEWRCTRTGTRIEPSGDAMAEYPPRSPFSKDALLRPDVVWFGEALPEEALERTWEAMATCDCFVSVGTSAVVYPAAGFAHAAARAGAFVAEVNAEDTPLTPWVSVALRGRSADLLPRLMALVGERI